MAFRNKKNARKDEHVYNAIPFRSSISFIFILFDVPLRIKLPTVWLGMYISAENIFIQILCSAICHQKLFEWKQSVIKRIIERKRNGKTKWNINKTTSICWRWISRLFILFATRTRFEYLKMWEDGERLNLELALLLMQQNSTLQQGADPQLNYPANKKWIERYAVYTHGMGGGS